jgi:hypothetical protein
MGLLDDAIREHLELKRARGADLTEVERQEREALGATPQAEFAEAEAAESAEAHSGTESAGADSADEPVDPPAVAEEEPADEREPFDVEALESAPPAPETDPWLEEERDEVPAEESLAHPREEPEEPSEDVLEDTPDFLQETPEHDRLWFEQRPPRDFDWDK